MGQTIDHWLATHAAHQPDHPALIVGCNRWTYGELNRWVNRMAAGLALSLGIGRGDRIAFLGHNSAEEIALFFAAARLGAIVVPLNWRLAAGELGHIIHNAGISALLHGPEMAGMAVNLAAGAGTRATDISAPELAADPSADLPAAAPGDPFLIIYTSGTTGHPKGAVLTQEAVFWNALTSRHAHDFSPKDHILNMLPLFHAGGINIQMMPCFYVGGTVTLMPAFDPSVALSAFETGGITVALVVPTIMRALFDHPDWEAAKLPHVRLLAIGSTDVPVDIIEAVHARNIPMIQIYGATETGPVTSYQRAAEARATAGSVGRAGLHVAIRIVDETGRDCAMDEPGEIRVKSPGTFSHYWQNTEATDAAIADGWFCTGDVARRDAYGLLWFVGRLKHVIISGGENIYPAELERILSPLPGVTELAVVGRQDNRWGEIPVIVAVAGPDGPDRDTLLKACIGRVAHFKLPRDVVFTDALPRNALGKVMFDEVKNLASKKQGHAICAASAADKRGDGPGVDFR
ncbi:MAG: AMP-binding protein [Rhodobacteraceae bacterium]|nr:AMP-binding protein [Paracoccaceae bacterium]